MKANNQASILAEQIKRKKRNGSMGGEEILNLAERIQASIQSGNGELVDLLQQASNALLRQNAELREVSGRLSHALDILNLEMFQVREIQESLLPQSIPVSDHLEYASEYLPSSHASGDYYDFLEPTNHHTGILVADVSGHGAASAVVMAITRVLARAHLTPLLSAGGALSVLNDLMWRFVPGSLFVTAAYAIYNHLTNQISYATAGHPAPILWKQSTGSVSPLKVIPRFPLKLFDRVEYETLTLDVEPGDTVIFYTDGITELESPEGDLLGEERFMDWISNSPSKSAAGILWHLLDQASLFTHGEPPRDDFTIVIVRRKPGH